MLELLKHKRPIGSIEDRAPPIERLFFRNCLESDRARPAVPEIVDDLEVQAEIRNRLHGEKKIRHPISKAFNGTDSTLEILLSEGSQSPPSLTPARPRIVEYTHAPKTHPGGGKELTPIHSL